MSALKPPAAGSPCAVAIEAIKAAGEALSETKLALALDCADVDVGQVLNYPIRMGVIRRSLRGTMRCYTVGSELVPHDMPEPAPVPPRAAAQPAQPPAAAPAPKPAAPVLDTPARHRAVDLRQPVPAPPPAPARIALPVVSLPLETMKRPKADKPAPAPAPAPKAEAPLQIPTFLGWIPPAGQAADSDAADVAIEAATAAGIRLKDSSGDGNAHARELIAAVLPALQVKHLDVAPFMGGRLLLELDGMTYVLLPAEVQRLNNALIVLQGFREAAY